MLIIPLNFSNENKLLFSKLNQIESAKTYVCGIATIAKFEMYRNYPIKNKDIAIKNILSFFTYIDYRLNENTINDIIHSVLPMSATKIIEFFSMTTYKDYMTILAELEILTAVPYDDGKFYEINNRTMQYRVHNTYIADDPCLVLFLNDNPDLSLTADKYYNKKIKNTLHEIKIDYRLAIEDEITYHIENKTKFQALKFRIQKLISLNGPRYIKKGTKVDRIYHSLSNISKISRKYLYIPLANNVKTYFNDIDVVNCQPLLLCALLKSVHLNSDLEYQYACQTGQFYESFMNVSLGLTRTEIKIALYQCIFFAFKPNMPIAKKFKELYPNTYNSLEILNRDKETTLAAKLQNLEAAIFNNIQPKKSKYYYTLFDSIYFTDIDDIVQLMIDIKEKFSKYDIMPMLTINGGTENDIDLNLVED